MSGRLTAMGLRYLTVLLIASLGLFSGCAQHYQRAAASPAEATAASEASTSQRPEPPCDPGFGGPKPREGCPDTEPETGWLSRNKVGRVQLQPFRTFTNDIEGRAYAVEHDLEFPYPNNTLDVAVGSPISFELAPDTVCTGAILVGYQEPLADHVVDCAEIMQAVDSRPYPLPVAVWCEDRRTFQVSELYRP